MPRLFFALQPLPQEKAAMHLAAQVLAEALGARAIHAEDLHMTLCFLGEVPEAAMPALAREVDRIEPVSVQLVLDRVDWWRRARVLCLVPEAEPASVQRLAVQLREACGAVDLHPDPKPFRAHVTLARKAGAAASARAWPQRLPHSLSLTAEGFVLMRSTGGGDGPRYAVVHAWPPAAQARKP